MEVLITALCSNELVQFSSRLTFGLISAPARDCILDVVLTLPISARYRLAYKGTPNF
jgi:hypothetical protein